MDLAWEDRVLGALVARQARLHGDRPFLVFRDRQVTFSELDARSSAAAHHLARLGIGHGDRVAIMLPNCPEYLYLWFGLARLGAIEVPLNTAHRGDLLGYMLEQAEVRLVVIQDALLDRLEQIPERLSRVERVVVASESGRLPSSALGRPLVPLAEVLEGTHAAPDVTVKPSDIFCFMFTSGTTGPSKAAMLPHAAATAFIPVHLEACGYTTEDVLYTCLPLFHGNAQMLSTVPALVAGARLHLAERFHASTFWEEMARAGATAFNYIGGMLTMLYKQPPSPADRAHRARIAFGAAAPANLWAAIEERFGVTIIEGFGLTESGAVLCNYGPERRAGSIGRPTRLYDVRVVDEEDREVPPGVIGEIVSRPNTPHSMAAGYYRMPEKTLEAFRNLWFHTGDLGHRDADGYFYFVDRKKDAIRRRGENISSFEVEKVVNAHPKVEECAALAHPSELGEDEVRVVVVLREGETLAPEDLLAWCEPRMAYFMVPRFVEFRASLPKTPTARVEKYRLRQDGLGPGAWDREQAGYRLGR